MTGVSLEAHTLRQIVRMSIAAGKGGTLVSSSGVGRFTRDVNRSRE